METMLLEESCINGTLETVNNSSDEFCSDMFSLLKFFQDIYSQKLSAIENNDNLSESEKTEEKLLVVQSYVEQLLEQNDTFASTMMELEKEACQRVIQMEKRLKSTAKTTMEAVINMHDCEKEMRRLVEERLCIENLYTNAQKDLSSMKVENGFLRDQNFNLNHDVQALLHVIHHARSTGHWEMDCVTFCEVTPEQVFGPVQSISQIYTTESDSQLVKDKNIKEDKNNENVLSMSSSKCVSLPDIGNIYSYTQVQHKSDSCGTNLKNRIFNLKVNEHKTDAKKVYELSKNVEQNVCVRKGQSEPHLFMFNGNIYKYRPCEFIKKASNDALNENYQSSLPPYQSIDLKFPTEGSTLSAWNKLKSHSYLEGNSFLKDDSSNSSCSCLESEFRGLNHQMFKFFNRRLSSCVHNEKSLKCSVGLQTEADEFQIDQSAITCDKSESQLVQELKEDLIKSKTKAEEKGILIEQLQNHLTSAVKEIELKDEVLNNLERKLKNSRDECSNVKNQVTDLNSEIQLLLKKLEESHAINAGLKLQVEQQNQIIRNLQEALVQSKRAFDAAHPKMPLLQTVTLENQQMKSHTSKNSVVDI